MIIILIIIAAVLIVAALRDTQGDLFAALMDDMPAFMTWAAAILVIGALGYIPGFKTISRSLLALIIVVIVVNNYEKIASGFNNAWKPKT